MSVSNCLNPDQTGIFVSIYMCSGEKGLGVWTPGKSRQLNPQEWANVNA